MARDLTGPSPLAAEVLNAAPYAFLDDAPLEERRTQAVQSRRWGADDADDLGRLDPDAITAVREEAWPQVRDADEMHEALTLLGFVTVTEAGTNAGWDERLQALAQSARATRLTVGAHPVRDASGSETESSRTGCAPTQAAVIWTSAEQLPV